MMNAALAAAALLTPSMILAQTAPVLTPAVAVTPTIAAPASTSLKVPGNSPVTLVLNAPLNSKANLTGEKFSLTVAQDVMAGTQIVIPKGTRAVGQINYSRGSGSFGKSGQIELVFRYLDLNGKQIPLDGHYYQEGRGNGAAAVGAVLGAGVIGGLIVKGHNVDLSEGREFSATIPSDVLFVSSNGAVSYDAAYSPTAVSMQVETEKERKARFKAAKH